MINSKIKEQFESTIDVMESVSVQCVRTFFLKECDVKEKWKVVTSLRGDFDYILAMSGNNKKYQALIYIGIPEPSIPSFTGETGLSSEAIIDIFGEFTNTYLGMLDDDTTFTDQFGILVQGIPILHQSGKTFLPFITGVEGYLHIKENWVYVGFAIKED